MLRTFKDDKEFYSSLPRKRLGAGVLLFYKSDLLIVQPTYNPGWILPGGDRRGRRIPSGRIASGNPRRALHHH